MKRLLAGLFLGFLSALAVTSACSAPGHTKKQLKDACARNLDCAYGLDCVDSNGNTTAAVSQDAGPATATGRTCQWHSYGDCEGDGMGQNGQPQCLSGYKCRESHCTVQCVAKGDCKEGEVCKTGLCQKGGNAPTQCYDNRDCLYPDTCFYGQCVTRTEAFRCQTDLDCGQGFRCIAGRCQ